MGLRAVSFGALAGATSAVNAGEPDMANSKNTNIRCFISAVQLFHAGGPLRMMIWVGALSCAPSKYKHGPERAQAPPRIGCGPEFARRACPILYGAPCVRADMN